MRTEGETPPVPSGPGGVVLDIGGDVGALVLYGPAEIDGWEIEISRERDPVAVRTHSQVRRRVFGGVGGVGGSGGSAVYAAVYPGLRAGVYTVWRDERTPAGSVTVVGGEVASFQWA